MRWYKNEWLPTILRGLSALCFIGLLVMIGIERNLLTPDFDATDAPPFRSGLGLHTDYGTGCEYLTAPRGGITPRLNSQGNQTGCR